MKKELKRMQTSNPILMISSIYNSLTKAEKKVADAVRDNPEEAVMFTVTDLSEKAGVGETSVIRFCRKLGFRGYHDFKLAVAQDLVHLPSYITGEIDELDEFDVIIRKMTQNHESILKSTMDLLRLESLQEAVELLVKANKIYIYGVGSSGITALDAHYRLMRLGMNVEVQRDSHIIAMSAALAGKGDVVLGITTSGSTKDLVDPIAEAKRNGAGVVCLTSHAKSPITQIADAVLLIPSKETPFQGGALTTKIAQIHVIDIVATLIAITKKETAYASVKKTANAVADKLY
ncbi:MurR/RpiR family transcriptional regulator [Paenibacillus cisolokensis]|uniref:MurR/RpiR family transcriptional regulator n=1 Tax=Paenibacillus cisolokensis TaxID=1658519 RepID=UPI003D2A5CAF